jgi:exodeoxyribonuclease VIII
LIDLKTTQDASLDGFQRSIANFRYHVQAAHYLRTYTLATGNKPKGFIFVAVEKTYPFAVQVFKCSDELIGVGLIAVLRNLEQLKESFQLFPKETPWPSYSNQMVEINLPPWARS